MNQLAAASLVFLALVSPAPIQRRQAASIQKRQTDREVDGLKGTVKSAVTEIANYKLVQGESVEGPRLISGEQFYDAEGNRLQWKHYDAAGTLSTSLVFSFIGQKRVAVMEDVDNKKALVRVIPLPRGTPVDPRYTYRFVNQYDANGRRTQEAWYTSSGLLFMRWIYTVKGDRRKRSVYRADRSLSQSFEDKHNDKGEEIVVVLTPGLGGDKSIYRSIEVDAQGNWTKRILTRGLIGIDEKLFPEIKPWSIEYRKLTYY